MRNILIIHPSRSRPEIAKDVRSEWLRKADNKENILYVFSIDTDDPFLTHYGHYEFDYKPFPNKSAIEAINRVPAEYYKCSECFFKWDILIVVSDDFDCPEHWDTLLLQALEGKEDFCVKTKDGIQRTLMTLPIMDRKYYERFGYIYHPDYIHMYSDQEMTAVAHMLGRNIDVDILFEHKHYSTGKFKKDAISIRNDKSYEQGKQVFDRRLRYNFGIDNPIKPYSSIKWH